ncbi:uncharacterized protein B0T15DRAFT_529063 [Chaetomium strumarium]|uniref:Secreted protein n=1 Tax=Chaetomium strumarium TaxID=1170767 RepID=A0AAJ0M300_9PEZI|nr:hypothetical protein B0T15DRAFT_529063 [Chaetomium strumarium]
MVLPRNLALVLYTLLHLSSILEVLTCQGNAQTPVAQLLPYIPSRLLHPLIAWSCAERAPNVACCGAVHQHLRTCGHPTPS